MTDSEVASELYEFLLYDGFNDRGFELGEREGNWLVVRDQKGVLHRVEVTTITTPAG